MHRRTTVLALVGMLLVGLGLGVAGAAVYTGGSGGSGAEASTGAAPPAPVRVVAVGDIACDPDEDVDDRHCAQRATSDLALSLQPDAVLALGDLQYEEATLERFQASYTPTWGRLLNLTHPTPGNHEYQGEPQANAYYDYFGAAAGPDRRGWYSLDLGAWHVVSLNSNCVEAGGCGADSPQGRWLAQDLTGDDHRCTVAFWHHPRWSNSTHGDTEEVGPLVSMLYDAGVELLLTGHEHVYQRFAPRTPDGVRDDARGVRELVIGTGGRSFYDLRTRDGLEAGIEQRFGVLDLSLAPDGYTWRFRPVGGPAEDAGSGTCH